MSRPIKDNRRFVNVYEITEFNTSGNSCICIGSHESLDYNEAKISHLVIRTNSKFQDPRFSVQLQDYNAFEAQKML